MIIAIAGKQLAGKTTGAKFMKELLPSHTIVHLADALKDQYCIDNMITRDELEANKHLHRQGLIDLGGKGRAISDRYWVDKVLSHPSYPNLIIPDLRFLSEYNALKEHDVYFISVIASREIRSKRGILACEDDQSENELDLTDYEVWNEIIYNESTEIRRYGHICKGLIACLNYKESKNA